MKISYHWLKEYLALTATPEEVAGMLTGCGLEVEGMEIFESVKGGLDGMVIGEVLEKTKHPNADKLSITRVDIGDGSSYQIVCGAPNVDKGQKVVVATMGAKLYPLNGEPFEIKKSKIRGEVSEGMICAEDEIGIGSSHAGILVLPPGTKTGMRAADFFKVHSDTVFEIGLTPNRADATSHFGVARDLAAVWNANRLLDHRAAGSPLSVNRHSVENFKGSISSPVSIHIADEMACPRYSGLFISGVLAGESPSWLKDRLLSVGLKPLNVLVDITNYVMLETGQPLHAFDAGKIQGLQVRVDTLPPGTPFLTLDGIKRELRGDELMISDRDKGLCMAGIYGGLDSGISSSTQTVFLESAYFNPTLIRKASRHHGLKTDASFRFERGADPEMTIYALKRAALLMAELIPGIQYAEIQDCYPRTVSHPGVSFSCQWLDELAGMPLQRPVVREILRSLGIRICGELEDTFSLEIPSFKPDVTRPADIAEEVLRIYGYNRISQPSKLNNSLPRFTKPERLEVQERMSRYLAAQGFHETLNNSLVSITQAGFPGLPGEAIPMLNPLSSDLANLRQTLLFSGLQSMLYNINRKNNDLRFFEFGKVYFKDKESYREENHLQVMMTGRRYKPHWMQVTGSYSVYYLKSLMQNLLKSAGGQEVSDYSFREEPRECYTLYLACFSGNTSLGGLGMIRKKILSGFDIHQDVFSLQVNMDVLLRSMETDGLQVTDVPRFPEVKRDLSMVLDHQVSYASVEKTARESEKKLLKRIQLFDVYEGKNVEPGKKSFAVSFFLGDDRKTLEDKQIDAIMEKLMKNLEQKLGAVIRKGADQQHGG